MPTGHYERHPEHGEYISQGLRASKKRIGRPPGPPKVRPPVPFGFTGRTHTEASKAKISASCKGKGGGRYNRNVSGNSSISVGQQRIMCHLEEEGYKIYHKGWPDILAVSPGGRILMLEVKRPDGYLTQAQREVHAILLQLGVEVKIVRMKNVWEDR